MVEKAKYRETGSERDRRRERAKNVKDRVKKKKDLRKRKTVRNAEKEKDR